MKAIVDGDDFHSHRWKRDLRGGQAVALVRCFSSYKGSLGNPCSSGVLIEPETCLASMPCA